MDGSGSGWDLCAGLFYEHRFAMLIIVVMVANVLKLHTRWLKVQTSRNREE